MQNLVIVESPTKARTLERFLGSDYKIIASMGHVRDLPKSEIGVDTEHEFEPKYIIPRDKRKRVNELKKEAGAAKILWLATDPDREGEAIAWHIAELLRNSEVTSNKKQVTKNIKRVVFHEITEEAIKEAFKHPRDLDLNLIDAQQARRVLDRLVGYKLSPLLWQKIKRGLSAGRVQSVALRLIVEKEKEVLAFKPVEYWSIEAELSKHLRGEHKVTSRSHLGGGDRFVATLIEKDGKKLEIKNKKDADKHVNNLEKAKYSVSKITKKEVKRYPAPPFTTSTLQQTAANRLGFTSKKTMMLAQNLYEQGFITYMRTDSVNLAVSAISAARDFIGKNFGNKYLPKEARVYKSKSKNAQEAHEAIRSTDVTLQGDSLRSYDGLNKDHIKLYDLIRMRFLACQMNEALLNQTSVDIKAGLYTLRATGSVIKFDGWLKLMDNGKLIPQQSSGQAIENEKEEENNKEKILPELAAGENLDLLQLLPDQHSTEPPPRYNEASLIKKLEELGIGRPSTYAPIISTIQERFYVERLERKFIPTSLGFSVNDFIVKYFPDIVDYQFTAAMENELDEVARGERKGRPAIKEFYTPFEKKIEETETVAEHVKLEVELAGKKCPDCGKELVVRTGRFGKFFACSGFPDCKHTEGMEQITDVKCPEDGGDIVVRRTKRGKTFYGCKNWPGCKFASWTKPKSTSVIASEAKQSSE